MYVQHIYVCMYAHGGCRLAASCDALLDACETTDWDLELIEVREKRLLFSFLSA